MFARPKPTLVKRILDFKRDVSSLRRVDHAAARRRGAARAPRVPADLRSAGVPLPRRPRSPRPAVGRGVFFQDRITSLLDAHLSNVSNQLNGVMKVLTIISTIFMPMTVLTGMYGMNVPLPHLPGGEHAQFWWILGDHGRGDVRRCSGSSEARDGFDEMLNARMLSVELQFSMSTFSTQHCHDVHQILPPHLANQIAAGEVVERPASVVKELVENALDAGATRIAVTIELGGKKSLRVEDDGEGMDPEDARLAIERHATSKIASSDDLAAIRTLGFRGEALPSIASVSHFTLRTRARGSASGTEIRVNGGTVASEREVGAPEGTCIEVDDLFYNLPARRKFLKSDTAESTQISRLVTQMALGYPEVGFSLTSGGRRLLECPPADGLARAVLPVVRRARRSDRGAQGGRRAEDPRLRRGARRSGAGARRAERLRQPPHRQGPDDRARDHRGVQRRDDQGAQPGSAPVPRDCSRPRRRQRASDEGGGAVSRAVAGARSAAPRARRGARPGRAPELQFTPFAPRPGEPQADEHSRGARGRVGRPAAGTRARPSVPPIGIQPVPRGASARRRSRRRRCRRRASTSAR